MFSHKVRWYPLFSSKEDLEALFVLRKAVVHKNMFATVLLIKDGEDYHAFRNNCPHQNKPLEHCSVEDGLVICPFHRYAYSLENGRGHGMCLDKYELKFDAQGVWLGIERWSFF